MLQQPTYRIISYQGLTSSLPVTTLKKTHYMIADPLYDDKYLYDLCMDLSFLYICPVRRYKNTPQERLQLVDFYESALGQVMYSNIITSIELLIKHINSIFRFDPLPVRGYGKVCNIILLSVLLYQILIYYNSKLQKKEDGPRLIKYMIDC